ncbi:hypothetical protein KC19_3G072500 [Ceratodon purpureus]|uniref:Uncharacterized protein n=1 Tax=Ceratodon purpureus TaxID=3225 RepID=A0A8T0IIG5_CERPU|nr:hypothetical protein KC19_3G072500 [Ceratodon purpureus]
MAFLDGGSGGGQDTPELEQMSACQGARLALMSTDRVDERSLQWLTGCMNWNTVSIYVVCSCHTERMSLYLENNIILIKYLEGVFRMVTAQNNLRKSGQCAGHRIGTQRTTFMTAYGKSSEISATVMYSDN